VLCSHPKQYLISQATNRKLAEEGGDRPLPCRLPVGELRAFSMTVGDDLEKALREKRIRSSRLVIKLKDCNPKPDQLNLRVNGQTIASEESQFETHGAVVVITLVAPPIHRGANTIKLGLKPGSDRRGLINSIDLNVDYRSPDDERESDGEEPGVEGTPVGEVRADNKLK